MGRIRKSRKSNVNKKQSNNKKTYVDPYELKGENNSSYLKELAGLTALLGAGTVGATLMPTGKVKAATNSIDSGSEIVGSVSKSANGTAQSNISKSNQNDLSTSQITSTSVSVDKAQSLSNSFSISQSVLSSLSLAKNQRDSNSQSSSSENKESKVSSQRSQSNAVASESESIQSQQSTSASSSETSNSVSSLSNSLNNQEDNLELGAITLSTLNGANFTGTTTSNLKNTTNSVDQNQLGVSKVANKLDARILAADPNSVDVSTTDDFFKQINNSKSTATTINLTGDIDLGSYKTGLFVGDDIKIGNPRSITINANGHTINFGSRYIDTNWEKTSPQLVVTFKDANIYTASQYGSVWLDGPTLGNSSARLVYDNVNATGGTTVSGSTTTNGSTDGLRDFEIKGTTTITGVDSYDYNGQHYNTKWQSYDTNDKPLIATPYNTIIDSNANVTLDGGNVANNIIVSRGNIAAHTVTIGDNATVVMKNAIKGDITFPDWNTVKPNPGNTISIGKNANVTLATQGTNISLNGDQSNKYQGMSGVTNLVTFGEGSTVTMTGDTNFNVGSNTSATAIQINNPNIITLNNKGGQAYTSKQGSTAQYQFDIQNTNVEVTQNNNGSNVVQGSPYIDHENVYITPGTGTVTEGGGTITNPLPIQPSGVKLTDITAVQKDIVNSNATSVVYHGYIPFETSVTTSESVSNSIVESTSTSTSESESISNSEDASKSLSESISNSENASKSLSESISNSEDASKSLSESISNSEDASKSLSESISNSETASKSLSESISNSEDASKSLSESISNSEDASKSLSESISNSVIVSTSASRSLSRSLSRSESISISVSESLSIALVHYQNIDEYGRHHVSPSLTTLNNNVLSAHYTADSVENQSSQSRKNQKLPQTGSENNSNMGILGMLGAALGLLGLGRNKRRNKK